MKTIKLHMLVVMLITAASSASFGSWGLFTADRSYIGFNNSIGADAFTVYNSGVGDIQGAVLGTFSGTDTLTLSYYDVKTFKNGADDVTGGTFFWRVYKVGDTPGSYSSISLGWQADLGGGNQKWGISGRSDNLLSGLSFSSGLTNYKLEFYAQMNGTGGSVYDNGTGANYTANISTVPEPSTFALLGVGGLALGYIARRRKA
jgi:hypothetical protein